MNLDVLHRLATYVVLFILRLIELTDESKAEIVGELLKGVTLISVAKSSDAVQYV